MTKTTSTTYQETKMFKGWVRHDEKSQGIFCYWHTMKSALEWISGFPNAIEAKIDHD